MLTRCQTADVLLLLLLVIRYVWLVILRLGTWLLLLLREQPRELLVLVGLARGLQVRRRYLFRFDLIYGDRLIVVLGGVGTTRLFLGVCGVNHQVHAFFQRLLHLICLVEPVRRVL